MQRFSFPIVLGPDLVFHEIPEPPFLRVFGSGQISVKHIRFAYLARPTTIPNVHTCTTCKIKFTELKYLELHYFGI